MAAVPGEEWRLPDKRMAIIKKLEEAFAGIQPNSFQQSPQELERAVYEKSKSRDEYNRYLQQVLLRLTRNRRPVGQPGGMPGAGSTGGMMPGGGMGMNPPAPGYNSQYQQYPGGVHPGSMSGGGDMGIGVGQTSQPPGYGHPGYRPAPPNQPFNTMRMGGPQMYRPPMMTPGGYSGMGHPPYTRHIIPRGMPMGGPGMAPRPSQVVGSGMGMSMAGGTGMGMSGPIQNPNPSFNSQGMGVNSVQVINNPSYTGPPASQNISQTPMQPSSRPEVPPTSVPITTTATNDQSKGQQNTSIGNPPTPHPPSMQGGVPSPAPPTPLYPSSPATSVGSPAQQSITPEENEVYMRKLTELQKYIPLLQKWITRLGQTHDDKNQLPKLRQLYKVLTDSSKRVPLATLVRCGEALDKMLNSDQSSRETHPSISDPTTPRSTTTPHNEPIVPQPKLMDPRHSPSLLEFKRVPSPPASYESLLGAIHTRPLLPERLPPAKRMCNRDEPSIPFSLMRELSTISGVRVKHVTNENRFDKSTTLHCTLDDNGLPQVPPLTIRIPSNYPLSSPICDLTPYHTSTSSTLITEVGQTLSERLSRNVHTYSLSSLLADWEMCVLKVMSQQLSAVDASL